MVAGSPAWLDAKKVVRASCRLKLFCREQLMAVRTSAHILLFLESWCKMRNRTTIDSRSFVSCHGTEMRMTATPKFGRGMNSGVTGVFRTVVCAIPLLRHCPERHGARFHQRRHVSNNYMPAVHPHKKKQARPKMSSRERSVHQSCANFASDSKAKFLCESRAHTLPHTVFAATVWLAMNSAYQLRPFCVPSFADS